MIGVSGTLLDTSLSDVAASEKNRQPLAAPVGCGNHFSIKSKSKRAAEGNVPKHVVVVVLIGRLVGWLASGRICFDTRLVGMVVSIKWLVGDRIG